MPVVASRAGCDALSTAPSALSPTAASTPTSARANSPIHFEGAGSTRAVTPATAIEMMVSLSSVVITGGRLMDICTDRACRAATENAIRTTTHGVTAAMSAAMSWAS